MIIRNNRLAPFLLAPVLAAGCVSPAERIKERDKIAAVEGHSALDKFRDSYYKAADEFYDEVVKTYVLLLQDNTEKAEKFREIYRLDDLNKLDIPETKKIREYFQKKGDTTFITKLILSARATVPLIDAEYNVAINSDSSTSRLRELKRDWYDASANFLLLLQSKFKRIAFDNKEVDEAGRFGGYTAKKKIDIGVFGDVIGTKGYARNEMQKAIKTLEDNGFPRNENRALKSIVHSLQGLTASSYLSEKGLLNVIQGLKQAFPNVFLSAAKLFATGPSKAKVKGPSLADLKRKSGEEAAKRAEAADAAKSAEPKKGAAKAKKATRAEGLPVARVSSGKKVNEANSEPKPVIKKEPVPLKPELVAKPKSEAKEAVAVIKAEKPKPYLREIKGVKEFTAEQIAGYRETKPGAYNYYTKLAERINEEATPLKIIFKDSKHEHDVIISETDLKALKQKADGFYNGPKKLMNLRVLVGNDGSVYSIPTAQIQKLISGGENNDSN